MVNSKNAKIRVDKLMLERGLAPSRARAQAYLLAGKVLMNNQPIEKPGTLVLQDCELRLRGEDHPFVSRGGLKLDYALQEFQVDLRNRIGMDVGASTGGFTDCLLQRGAAYVFAVDVGYGQLAWKLMQDSRVCNLERTNFRTMQMGQIGTFVDVIVIDASFISLTVLLGNTIPFLVKGGCVVALIKPQFEAGRQNIQKGGIVKNPLVHQEVIQSVGQYARDLGFQVQGICDSPIQGKKKGNQEFLIHLVKEMS